MKIKPFKIFIIVLFASLLIFNFSCKQNGKQRKPRKIVILKKNAKENKQSLTQGDSFTERVTKETHLSNLFSYNEFPGYILISFKNNKWDINQVQKEVKITPKTPFTITKSDNTHAHIVFKKALLAKNQYNVNYKDSSVVFITPDFSVGSIDQSGYKKPVFDITFNQPVDYKDLISALKITGNNRNVNFSVLTHGRSKTHRLKVAIYSKSELTFTIKDLFNSYHNNKIDDYATVKLFTFHTYQLYAYNANFKSREDGFDLIIKFREDDETGKERYKYRRWRYVLPDIDINDFKHYLKIEPRVRFAIIKLKDFYKIKADFKPNTKYTITVKKGLRAKNGKVLLKDFKYSNSLGNYRSSIKILSKGHVIPKIYENKIAVKTCNIDKMNIMLKQIYPQNIIFWLTSNRNYVNRNVSDELYRKEMKLKSPKNHSVISYLDLNTILPKDKKGIFYLELREDYNTKDAIELVISDLAISAKKGNGKLHVYVHSFVKLTPIANAKVKSYSYSNKLLEEKTTNINGEAIFSNTKSYAIIVEKGDDLNYLPLDEPKIDLTEYDVSGENYNNEYEYKAYVYTDRGVYRPNDKANISIIIRNNEKMAPVEQFPLRVKIFNALNKVIYNKTVKPNNVGMATLTKQFYNTPSTGKYRVEVFLKKDRIGNGFFNVEEFTPERMKVTIDADKDIFIANDNIDATLKAMYLFGASAKSEKYEVEYSIIPFDFKFPDIKNYKFGQYFLNTPHSTYISTEKGKLNKKGEKDLNIYLSSNNINIKSPVKLRLFASVFEAGSGKTTKGYKTLKILPQNYLIGLKCDDAYAYYHKPIDISGIIVNSKGKKSDKLKQVHLELLRVDYDWYYYYDDYDSEYDWKWVPYTYSEQAKVVDVKNGKFSYSFTPDSYWGGYIVKATDDDNKIISEVFLPAQWEWRYSRYTHRRSSQLRKYKDPEFIKIQTDKNEYSIGEIAKIKVNTKYEGIIHFSVETDNVIYDKWYNVKEGENEINYKIKEDVPNVYFVVNFFKQIPDDLTKGFQPMQGVGVKNVKITPAQYALPLIIESPDTIQPNDEFTITLKSDANESEIYATVAIVDEGILQLTRFKTPKPLDFYFKKCALGVNTYENYGWLMGKIGNMQKQGGGEWEEKAPTGKKRATPIKIVSLWKGIIRFKNGKANVKMKVPYFNGQLRVMAVVASKEKMGSAEKKITVRDPLVLMPSIPRFLSSGDEIQIPVNITNFTGKKGEFKVEIITDDSLNVEANGKTSAKLRQKDSFTAKFIINVRKYAGTAKLTVKASGNEFYSQESFEIPIIPPVFEETTLKIVKLNKGRNNLKQYFSDWIPEYENDTILVNALPFYNGLLGIKRLVRYPFGCIEQTTSSTFPLLYIDKIIKPIDPSFFKNKDIHKMVMHGINRVLDMQLPSGGFGYWSGSYSVCDWGTVYATHMLLEAKKAGYNVPESGLKAALDWIENMVYYKNYEYYKAYGLYVLALSGRKNISKIHDFIKKIKRSGYRYVYRRGEQMFLLGAALAIEGKRDEAISILAPYFNDKQGTSSRSDNTFYSHLRYLALKLFLLQEIDPKSDWNENIALDISGRLNARKHFHYYTTQEVAWSVCALGKFLNSKKLKPVKKVSLLVDGKRLDFEDQKLGKNLTETGLSEHKSIVLESSGASYAYISINGYPKYLNKENESNGLSVEVRSKNITGVDKPFENSYKVGDLGIVAVKITNLKNYSLKNVAVVVRIPSGFEIENPRLGASHAINWMNKDLWRYDHMDIRDDRLQIFGSLRHSKTVYFYFAVRATFGGAMLMPGTSAEVMYNPKVHFFGKIRNIEINWN
ncbi:hypothetical protein J7L48_08860 [bacterium]|nr:hypothetical protein [bacterium]